MTDNVDRRTFLKLTGSSTILLTAGNATAALTRDELRTAAKEDVSSRTGIPIEELTVIVDTKANFPTLEEKYYHAKLRDAEGGHYSSMIDGNGNPVDYADKQTQEIDAYKATYGSLSRELYNWKESASAGEKTSVGVWHDGLDRAAARDAVGFRDRQNDELLKQDFSEEVVAQISAASDALATDVSEIEGATVESAGEAISRVAATATPSAVEQIASLENVLKVVRSDYAERDTHLYESSHTHESYAHRNGDYQASGYRVGVHGLYGYPNSADVNVGGSYATFSSEPKDAHAHQVALAEASTDDNLPGIAHEADVYCARYKGVPAMDSQMRWFRWRDVSAVNFSWGWLYGGRRMREEDVMFSQWVHNLWLNLTISAGNENFFYGEKVGTPAKGINQFSVGAVDNEDTGTDTSDDNVASYSCWKDPLARHAYFDWGYYPIDKPEASAVGNPTEFPGYSGTTAGTSFSAPHVAGLITLLEKFMDDHGHWIPISWYPEVAKPIVMASATNTGDSNYDFQRMGTGTIVAPHVEHVVENNWFVSDVFWRSNSQQTYNFYANSSDQEVRVVLSWPTDPTKSWFWDFLGVQGDVDLDLSVLDPNGNLVGASWRWDGGYEYLTFDPQTSGTHRIVVDRDRWDSGDYARFMGLAWYRS